MFCIFKILFELEIYIFLCLKNGYTNLKAVFSLPHTQIHKFCFQLMGAFFHCLNNFSGFSSQSNPHSKELFLILRNTRFHKQFFMWTVTSLKSTIRQHIYCTLQNTKQVVSLCEEEALSKYGSIMFLRQLSSSNNRFAPENCVNVFCPAY